MRLESHDCGSQAACLCNLYQPLKQGLVAKMHAIKIADGKRDGRGSVFGKMAEYLHVARLYSRTAHEIFDTDTHQPQDCEVSCRADHYQSTKPR